MPKLDATPSHMLERGALGHCLTTLSYPRTRATARCSQRPCQPLPLPLAAGHGAERPGASTTP